MRSQATSPNSDLEPYADRRARRLRDAGFEHETAHWLAHAIAFYLQALLGLVARVALPRWRYASSRPSNGTGTRDDATSLSPAAAALRCRERRGARWACPRARGRQPGCRRPVAVSALALTVAGIAVDRSDGVTTVALAALLLCSLLIAYAATRVVVLWPFEHAEPIDLLGALTKLLEAAGLVLAVRLLHAPAGSSKRLAARTEGDGP